MPSFPFQVDSALLRELGERLVGKPHIALAELVKNAYDADATEVRIVLTKDSIEVIDNGHGMTQTEFKRFWMRIGTPHKAGRRVSRVFDRPLTGSKGVGRLAAQFLGRELEIATRSDGNLKKDPVEEVRRTASEEVGFELQAGVNWDEAIQQGELTKAEVEYNLIEPQTAFPQDKTHGTRIVISKLNQPWAPDDVASLAREIWWLQPPLLNDVEAGGRAFNVVFESQDQTAVTEFNTQMSALLRIWHAEIQGQLEREPGKRKAEVLITLTFDDGERIKTKIRMKDCAVHFVKFKILVYHLTRRQKFGVKVDKAREYLTDHGNVHIYDAGFHLPYYGPEQDWLRLEFDHAHRLSASQLLPKSMNVKRGMNFLPTQSRVLGIVNVNTNREQVLAKKDGRANKEQHLKIQLTRDRLEDNQAFKDLAFIVRWSIDFYAIQEARREFQIKHSQRRTEPAATKLQRIEQVLEDFKEQIDKDAFDDVRAEIADAIQTSDQESDRLSRQSSLLGALATAGISAMGFMHELDKQFVLLEEIAGKLRATQTKDGKLQTHIEATADEIEVWLKRARATRGIFAALSQEENRDLRVRLKAKSVLESIKRNLAPLVRGVDIDIEGVPDEMRLPLGSFAEWTAIFQNVIVNAANAMVGCKRREIDISADFRGGKRAIVVQDTGIGIDLSKAEKLFEPFVREVEIDRTRQRLGAGGLGLGLTIVRMVAQNVECDVAFAEPRKGFKTCFRVSWSEKK